MASKKHEEYRNIPLYTETSPTDSYTYVNVKDLADQCEKYKEETIKCRTLGILQSQHGKFWLADMDSTGINSEFKIRVSMVYLKSTAQSTVLSYPIQVFGIAQWKNRPVIFPTIMQVLSVPMAIRIKDIMNKIATRHLATSSHLDAPHPDDPT